MPKWFGNKFLGRTIRLLLCILAMLLFSPSGICAKNQDFKYEYGVFLGANPEDVSGMKDYRIIVIDAQGFSKKQIKKLKREGHVVYSYINPGSIETYRPYFKDYEKYTLSVYEHWEDEYWIDVSKKPWQKQMQRIARRLKKKGVDGLFVDNLDVYYLYHTEDIYKGLKTILKGFKKQGFYVVINGGDVFVKEYIKKNKKLDIIDGVNQESVFSKINWDDGSFGRSKASDRKYFQKYAALVKKKGGDVYFLEYSRDKKLKKKIRTYCKKKGYKSYIARDLGLSASE